MAEMRRDCEKRDVCAEERDVCAEERHYDTLSRTCTLTKNRCCAPSPLDCLRLDGEHDCRTCNVPVLFALIGLRDILVDIHDEIVLWKAEEKE